MSNKKGNHPDSNVLQLFIGCRELHDLANHAHVMHAEMTTGQEYGICDPSQAMQARILRDVYDTFLIHRTRANRWRKGFSWTLMPFTLRVRDTTMLSIFQHIYYTKLRLETVETRMLHRVGRPNERDPDFWLQNHVLDIIYRAAARAWEDELVKCLRAHALKVVMISGNKSPEDFEEQVEARLKLCCEQGWV
jgi:hypothetical protein